jgi:hypothetical protein
MKPQPSLEELDILVSRLHARLAARNTVLARWFKETMAVMEARFAAKLEDPRDLAGARSAALVFVKAALHQWATRPPLEHQAKAPSESIKSRKTGLRR